MEVGERLMASSTDSTYYWYIRKGPLVDTIGLVGEDGDAVDSSLTVELRGEILDSDLTFEESDTFNIPDEFILPFVGGVAFELGVFDTIAYKLYRDAQGQFRGRKVAHKYSGSRILQANLRADKYVNTRTRDDE